MKMNDIILRTSVVKKTWTIIDTRPASYVSVQAIGHENTEGNGLKTRYFNAHPKPDDGTYPEIPRSMYRVNDEFKGERKKNSNKNHSNKNEHGWQKSKHEDKRPRCYYCGQTGHYRRNCVHRQNNERAEQGGYKTLNWMDKTAPYRC